MGFPVSLYERNEEMKITDGLMTQTTTSRPHLVWLDVARFLAILFVFVSHSADAFHTNAPESGRAVYELWGAIWGSSARFCVPLFVMISGVLLLPVRMETGAFYKKRLSRLVLPFLFWAILYNLLPWVISLCGGNLETLRIFIPFSDLKEVSFVACVPGLVKIPLTFNSLTTHLWYVYMLIGLYLFLPIFSAWFERASLRAKKAFLSAWGVSLCLPYVRAYLGAMIWGECDWNQFGSLYYFAGFLGYLVLGNVLAQMKDLSWGRTLAIAIPLFAAGYAMTFLGFNHARLNGPYGPAWELYWTFCSVNAAAMTTAVFLLAKKINSLPTWLERALADMSVCGYGIYLAHYAFIGAVTVLFIKPLNLPVPTQLPAMAFVSFFFVWGTIRLLRLIPGIRKLVS